MMPMGAHSHYPMNKPANQIRNAGSLPGRTDVSKQTEEN